MFLWSHPCNRITQHVHLIYMSKESWLVFVDWMKVSTFQYAYRFKGSEASASPRVCNHHPNWSFFLPLSIIADRQNEWQWTVNLFTQNSLNGHISRTPRTHYPLSSAIMLKLSFQIFTTNNLQHSRLQSSAESLPRCPVLSFLVCLLLMGFFFFFFNLDKEVMFSCSSIYWLVCQQVTWKKHLKLGRRMNLSPE